MFLKSPFLFCAIFAILGSNTAEPIEKPLLRGVTMLKAPYIFYNNGTYSGFLIEMMDKIGEKLGFEYQLDLAPDGAYGTEKQNGTFNGMIGEVNRTNFDFALADLTVTESRNRSVDFTIPFMSDPLAILINPELSGCIATFEELVNYNNKPENAISQIAIGMVPAGITLTQLSNSSDRIGRRLWDFATRNEINFVRSYADGKKRAKVSKFGMIMVRSAAKYIVERDCNFTLVNDNRFFIYNVYAIALPKGSKWVQPFSGAIGELWGEGIFPNLLKQFWNSNDCPKSPCTILH